MDKIKDGSLAHRALSGNSECRRTQKQRKMVIEGELIAYSNILELMEDEHENEED